MVSFSSFFSPFYRQDQTETFRMVWYAFGRHGKVKMLNSEPMVRSQSFFSMPSAESNLDLDTRLVWFGRV